MGFIAVSSSVCVNESRLDVDDGSHVCFYVFVPVNKRMFVFTDALDMRALFSRETDRMAAGPSVFAIS